MLSKSLVQVSGSFQSLSHVEKLGLLSFLETLVILNSKELYGQNYKNRGIFQICEY